MISSELVLNRIRAFAEAQNWKKSKLAKEAGLGDTTLRNFDNEKWNPTVKVLRKIEKIIPDDFVS